MSSLRQLMTVVVGLFSLTLAAENASDPIPPSQDPWYTAPENWRCHVPGDVLRVRAAPGNITAAVSGAASAYNIMYRTTDSLDKPSWAVTTLYVPTTPNPKALLNYQLAYDTHHLDDSPSYAVYSGITDTLAWSMCLAAGWYVNVPDYEGPDAIFAAGAALGQATLDSVRVVLGLKDKFGLAEDAQYVMWGYSGGASATEWAAELQGQYAPEMTFSGVAIGGLPVNLTELLPRLTSTPSAGLLPTALRGITVEHNAYDELLERMKTEGLQNATGWADALTRSTKESMAIFANQDIAEYFTNGFDFASEPLFANILSTDGVAGLHGTPSMPIYAYHAIQDEVVPVASADQVVNRHCLNGTNILYERNTVGGHAEEGLSGAYPALAWISSIFSGSYSSSYNTTGCTIRDVTVSLADVGI